MKDTSARSHASDFRSRPTRTIALHHPQPPNSRQSPLRVTRRALFPKNPASIAIGDVGNTCCHVVIVTADDATRFPAFFNTHRSRLKSDERVPRNMPGGQLNWHNHDEERERSCKGATGREHLAVADERKTLRARLGCCMCQGSRSLSRGQCGDPRNIDPAVSPWNSPTIGIQGQITWHLLFHVYSRTRFDTCLFAFRGGRSYYILFNRKCILGLVSDVYRSPFNPRNIGESLRLRKGSSLKPANRIHVAVQIDILAFRSFRHFFVALHSSWTRHFVDSDEILLFLTIRVACLYSKNLISRIVFTSLVSGCSSG